MSELFGERLADRVDGIFDRNTITPSAALEELRPISDRLNELDAALDNLLSSLVFFNIGAEELAPGKSELGYLVPRGEVHNDIGELGKEFRNIEGILRPFFELAEGSRPKVEVRSISSSAFQVLLLGTPGVAWAWGKAINRLVDAYQKVLQIRESRQGLKEAGASQKTLDSASQDAEDKMTEEIEQLVDKLLDEAIHPLANDRRNELKTSFVTRCGPG